MGLHVIERARGDNHYGNKQCTCVDSNPGDFPLIEIWFGVDDIIFNGDNTPCHEKEKESYIKSITWSAKITDLNPTENLWLEFY